MRRRDVRLSGHGALLHVDLDLDLAEERRLPGHVVRTVATLPAHDDEGDVGTGSTGPGRDRHLQPVDSLARVGPDEPELPHHQLAGGTVEGVLGDPSDEVDSRGGGGHLPCHLAAHHSERVGAVDVDVQGEDRVVGHQALASGGEGLGVDGRVEGVHRVVELGPCDRLHVAAHEAGVALVHSAVVDVASAQRRRLGLALLVLGHLSS